MVSFSKNLKRWEAIRKMYYTKSNLTVIYDLIYGILGVQRGEKSQAEHYSFLVGIFEELNSKYASPTYSKC